MGGAAMVAAAPVWAAAPAASVSDQVFQDAAPKIARTPGMDAWVKTYRHQQYALRMKITQSALEEDLYAIMALK